MYRRILHHKYFNRRIIALLFILSCLIIGTLLATRFTYIYFIRGKNNFDRIIEKAAKRHSVDPCLIKAIIWQESRFEPNARGNDGEIGLMQIMREYAGMDWAEQNAMPLPSELAIFTPEMNIEIGTWYLARALERWKDYKHCIKFALCEYNAGYSRVKKNLTANKNADILDYIDISSTKEYTISVFNMYQKYSEEKKEK